MMKNAFQTLPVVTRRIQVADALRAAILSGELPPGAKVTEIQLSADFGVSRGPIREAMRELIDEGLLNSRPYSGTQVSAIEEKTIVEAYNIRKILECYAFRLCWSGRDQTFRQTFANRHKALLRALEKDGVDASIHAEMAFHSVPYELCGNALLLTLWRQLERKIQLGFAVYQVASGGPEYSSAHERYIKMALGDDLDALIAEVENHIELGLETIHNFFRRREATAALAKSLEC
jgi:DNA-binding GntR family transcriptional regulator